MTWSKFKVGTPTTVENVTAEYANVLGSRLSFLAYEETVAEFKKDGWLWRVNMGPLLDANGVPMECSDGG